MNAPIAVRVAGPVTCAVQVVRRLDGLEDVVCGPLRATLHRDRSDPELAVQRFASPIAKAMEVPGGWVFVTRNGAVAASDTFLGRLRNLGHLPRMESPHPSNGRVALVGADGSLWTTDGREPLRRSNLPWRVVAAAFQDTGFGAALRDDGAVVMTHDGGATWSPVDLLGEQAWDVDYGEGGIGVTSTAGRQVLGREGHLVRTTCVDLARGFTSADSAASARGRIGDFADRATEVFDDPQRTPAVAEVRWDERRTEPRFPRVGPIAETCVRGERLRLPGIPPPPRPPHFDDHGYEVREADSLAAEGLFQPGSSGVSWRRLTGAGFRVGTTGPELRGTPEYPEAWSERAFDDGTDYVHLVAVSEGGVLLERAGDQWLEWGVSRGPTIVLRQPTQDCFANGMTGIGAAQTDGGVAYLMQRRSIAVAIDVAPTGRIRARRAVRRNTDTFVLARWGAAVGIATWDRDGIAPPAFLPLDGSAERAFPPRSSGPVRACGASAMQASPNAITLWVPGMDVRLGGVDDGGATPEDTRESGQTELEWTEGGMCVRSYQNEGVAVFAAPGNHLDGVHRTFEGTWRLRCTGDPG